MGIRRLTTFVNNNFTGWQREEIKGKLVIDGYSLCYHLYSFDWSHGGQYYQYRENISHYFISITQSGITPIVVLDGVDFKGEKSETITNRRNSSVKTVHNHTSSIQRRRREVLVDGVIPPIKLTLRVFLMVMQELNIEFIVVDGEGDQYIYELANMYSCPVLSNDSDFLVYKLKGGYIPLNRFHWETIPINGEVYYYQTFCSQMGFSDSDLRLAIPAIAGNDFLSPVESDTFMAYMSKNSPVDGRRHNLDISTVIGYIKEFESLQKLMIKIQSIPCVEEEDKENFRKNCADVRNRYDSEETTTLEKLNKTTELRTFQLEELPEWVLRQFRMGNFHSIGILVFGCNSLSIFIDDTSGPSCVQASELIRQFIYGLMGLTLAIEVCRERLHLVEKVVHANMIINGHALPSLRQIPTLTALEREDLLYSMLGCMTDPLFLRLPSCWKLVMAATMFWVTHCQPSPHQIKALILNFVVYATCSGEVKKMHEQFEIPIQFIRSPRWMPLLHVFSQWQSVYGDALSLNELLMLPLEPISPARLYDGKLVMFFALPENHNYLAGRLPIDHRLFDDLVGFVLPRSTFHHGFQPRKGARLNPDQPPRFQCVSSSYRSGPHHQRGNGQQGYSHRYVEQNTTRGQVQARSQKEEAATCSRRSSGGAGGRSYTATAGGNSQVHGCDRWSRDDYGRGLHRTAHARDGGSSSKVQLWPSYMKTAKSSSAAKV